MPPLRLLAIAVVLLPLIPGVEAQHLDGAPHAHPGGITSAALPPATHTCTIDGLGGTVRLEPRRAQPAQGSPTPATRGRAVATPPAWPAPVCGLIVMTFIAVRRLASAFP